MKCIIGLVSAFGLMVCQSFGELITFDDLSTPYNSEVGRVPSSYAGLNWDNFGIVFPNVSWMGPSGFRAGLVSGPNLAYNVSGETAEISGGLFTLTSAYLTAGWNDNLEVTVRGFAGTQQKYQSTYILSATAPTMIDFNFVAIDRVSFEASGGTEHGAYARTGGPAPIFGMDNLVITPVPEPTTAIDRAFLLLLPFGACAVRRLRKITALST